MYDYIKTHSWCHLLESCWLIRTNQTALQVRDAVKQLVDSNDRVATFDVTGVSWATTWTDDRTTWLHNNMQAGRTARL